MGHLERRSVTSPGAIHDCPCETNDARMRTFRIAHFHDGRKHRAPASEYMKIPSLVGVTIEKAGCGLFRAARKSFETSDVTEGRCGWSSSSRILDQAGRQKIEGDVRIGRVTGVSATAAVCRWLRDHRCCGGGSVVSAQAWRTAPPSRLAPPARGLVRGASRARRRFGEPRPLAFRKGRAVPLEFLHFSAEVTAK